MTPRKTCLGSGSNTIISAARGNHCVFGTGRIGQIRVRGVFKGRGSVTGCDSQLFNAAGVKPPGVLAKSPAWLVPTTWRSVTLTANTQQPPGITVETSSTETP